MLLIKNTPKIAVITVFTFITSILYICLNSHEVFAGSCSWNGTASGNWATASNWTAGCSGVGGIPGNGDTLTFPSSIQYTMNNNIVGLTVNTLIFSQGTNGSYILDGSSLTITNRITTTNTSDARISLPIIGNNLTKDEGGSLTLSGSTNNTLTGTFNMLDGTLRLNKTSNAQALSGDIVIGDTEGTHASAFFILDAANQISDASNITVNGDDGFWDLNGFSETINNLTINGAEVATHNGDITINDLIASFGTIDSGTGAINLGGNVSINGTEPGALYVQGDTLNLDNESTNFSVPSSVDSAIFVYSHIVGSADIHVFGFFTGFMSDNSAYTGTIYIGDVDTKSVLGIMNENSLGDTIHQTIVAAGSSYYQNINTFGVYVPESFQIAGDGYGALGPYDLGAIYVPYMVGAISGNIILTGDARITTEANGALLIDGGISGNYNLTIKGNSEPGYGVGFNHENSYVGSTTIINTGLYIMHENALNDDEPIIMQENAALFIGANDWTGPISGEGQINISSGTTLATVYQEGLIATFSGVIAGEGNLLKYGTGELILTSASPDFTGYLYNVEGLLTLNGNMPNALAETQGGFFGGIGSYGNMNIQQGKVAPGNYGATGILNIEGGLAVEFGDMTTFDFNLNGITAGSEYDQITATGDISLNNAILNLISGYSPVEGTTFILIKTTGNLTGTFNGLPDNSIVMIAGKSFTLNYTNNSVVLTLPALPVITYIAPEVETKVEAKPVATPVSYPVSYPVKNAFVNSDANTEDNPIGNNSKNIITYVVGIIVLGGGLFEMIKFLKEKAK